MTAENAALAEAASLVSDARTLRDAGDLSGAERMLRSAADSDDPAAAALAAGELGVLLHQQGQTRHAIPWFELAVSSGYTAAGSLAAYNLGLAQYQQGNYGDAESAWEDAVQLGHSVSQELLNLGHPDVVRDSEGALSELRSARDAGHLVAGDARSDVSLGDTVEVPGGAGEAGNVGPRQTAQPKSKAAAIVLVVLFGLFGWLYTYRRDAWKFWLNLGLSVVTLLIWGAAAWIWAIVDMARRPPEWFEAYPNG